MKVAELARALLEHPSYYDVVGDLDGWELSVDDVGRTREQRVHISLESPEGYAMRPDEPTDAMLEAASNLGCSPATLRVMYATMMRADDAENDE